MFLKNKLILWSPIIVLAISLIFSVTFLPSIHPVPKNLPIALVNEDSGVTLPNKAQMKMGDKVVKNIQQATHESKETSPVKWHVVKDSKKAMNGLNNRKYYAALIIPKDFSQKQASLQTPSPTPATMKILVNQGMNSSASAMAGQMLNGVVDKVNSMVRTQVLSGFEQKKGALSVKQATVLAEPIKKELVNVNAFGTHSANGNAPVSMFQPLWMASLIGAVLLFIATNKMAVSNRKEKLASLTKQLVTGIVFAAVVGFGLTWFAEGLLGLDIPFKTDTALFLSIAYLSFFLMISSVISWIGIKGVPIFALVLFFGVPLLSMAPEMMPDFYQDWIYPWLPMRFMVEGLRELFFFGKGLSWSHSVAVLSGIGLVSLVILFASSLKPMAKKEDIHQSAGELRTS